jgi:DNA-binding HxlR family transcriptional regulator
MVKGSLEKCPLQKMLESLGGKWKLLIISNIQEHEVIRYSALHKSIPGISQKVLTAQLKELEADKFILRKVYPEVPPRVEYRLSKTGKSLYPVLDSMAEWACNNLYK